ncbi:sensor histidine kinase [Terrimonas ferruginea]|uniref:sensor histidine kinase n=1 Tax=Terrimonas ferruginea TaxID=249 RepID=UPI000414CAE1|nr:HAMP domain-containing sensor histidine kinase [Terrimonas ferruginea]
MKRIFTIITILISLSLIGIIVFQISWLRNMILLQEDRVKQKVDEVGISIGNELKEYKASYMPVPPKTGTSNIFKDDFAQGLLNFQTVGARFTTRELYEKIRRQFDHAGLKDLKFEFVLMLDNPRNSSLGRIERQTSNFVKAYEDKVNNYATNWILIVSPSGSATENLASDEVMIIVALDWRSVVIQQLQLRIALAILFTLIIIAAFYLTVRTMLRQKKLGEIKNDFINNMTHEFKTPIATISLAVDAMKNERVLQDREKIEYFRGIIKEENQRMNRQVETILKASQLERQEVELNLKPLHVHEVIKHVVDNFALQLQEKNGHAELLLQAENDLIDADEVHFSNLVNNLVDNAVKYSKENVPVQLRISTQVDGRRLMMRFEDNGIGMNKETVKRVFERFYRAHTGNLHNVKGFGLGLSYVKTMIEGHHGEIKVESVLGKGSTFVIHLPLKKA